MHRIDKERSHPTEAKAMQCNLAGELDSTPGFPEIIKLLWEILSKSIDIVGTTMLDELLKNHTKWT